jgi:hypothetical protein
MAGTVRVRGLTELQSALKGCEVDVRQFDRKVLKQVGDPVAREAEQVAQSTIRNIGGPWSRMRVGLTSRLVYVAPAQRGGRGNSRPNLARLLGRAMEQALAVKEPEVIAKLERALDEIGARHGF